MAIRPQRGKAKDRVTSCECRKPDPDAPFFFAFCSSKLATRCHPYPRCGSDRLASKAPT